MEVTTDSAQQKAAPKIKTEKALITDFLIRELAVILEVSEEDIETEVAFDRYGVDSKSAVQLTGKLSTFIGKTVEPTVLYSFPTIDSLSAHLAEI